MANDVTATTPSPATEPIASASVGGAANDDKTVSVSADPSTEGQSGILPEKFRGPDGISKMTQAYTEAEKELRKAQEERAALKAEAERAKLLEQQLELVKQQQVQPVHSTEAPNEDELFMKEWEEDPARAVLNRQKRTEEKVRSTVQEKDQKAVYYTMKADKTNYPDFESYEAEMAQVARQYAPMLRPDQLTNPDLIPLLYNVVQARHLPDKIKSASEKAAADAAAKRAAKNAAMAEGGINTGGGGGTTSFGDLSIKEMENLLGFVDR